MAAAVLRELDASLAGSALTVARSRHTGDPADLHRAGAEALLAANVAEARGLAELSFEETGAYRLLLPAMSEDPGELRGFFEETVALLVVYDDQYETELVRTLESFLDADGNAARTAERLFTHRHTVRSLERVRELTSLTSPRPTGASACRSASRRCACSASMRPAVPRRSAAPRLAACHASARTARPRMARWDDFEGAAPELAARVRARLDAQHAQDHRHAAPRRLAAHLRHGDQDLRRRALDRLDVAGAQGARPAARPALRAHSGWAEPAEREGDAKLAGIAEEITDPETVRDKNGPEEPPEPSHLFRLELFRGLDGRPQRGAQRLS